MFLEKVYSGKNNWYLYLLSLLIIFTSTQIGSIPFVIYIFLKNPSAAFSGDFVSVANTNLGLALMLFPFVVGFFATLLCLKYIHGKKPLDAITGRSTLDWNRIFFSAGIWAGLCILTFAIQYIITGGEDIVFQFDPVNFIILVIITLLLIPFQTSFEEFIFRGYLMQWSALLFKYRWIALLFTSVLFGVMHGANPEVKEFGMWIAMPQYILMGLILGYVTIKDDGLELAIGLHMANNITAAITFTSDASALQTHALFKDISPSASFLDVIVILITGIIFIYCCNRKYHFMGKINLWTKLGE